MVRRGSTVRVRQRALQKSRKPVAFRSERLAEAPVCGRYGAVYGAFRSTTTGDNDHSGLNPAARRLRASSGSLPSVKRARSRAGTTYVLNRGPQSWTSDGSSQVDDHSHGRGRGSRGERRGACCPAGLPAHAAGRSEREPGGSRSSSAPTCRRKARICDRVSSSRDRVTAVRLAVNGARKPPLGEHGVRPEDVERVPAKMLRNAFARRPVLAASRSPSRFRPTGRWRPTLHLHPADRVQPGRPPPCRRAPIGPESPGCGSVTASRQARSRVRWRV
jgi:hypothetical protein